MSDEPAGKIALQNAAADFVDVHWQHRAATILVTLGVLAFGVMLGAHLMAADLLFGTPLPPLGQRYQAVMEWGVIVSGGCLVVGVGLDLRGDTDAE